MNSKNQTAAARGKFSGIGAKVAMIAIIPLVLFAILTATLNNITINIFENTIDHIEHLEHQKAAVEEGSIYVEQKMLNAVLGIANLASNHQRMLLMGNKGLAKKVAELRAGQVKSMEAYAAAMAALEETLKSSKIVAGNDAESKLDQKRINYLIRAASAMPRLYQMFVGSNQRTIELINSGNVNGARNNFVFEEAARLAALNKTVTKSTEILAILVNNVAARFDETVKAAQAESESNVNSLVMMSYLAIALVLLVMVGFSAWYALNRLAKPLRNMVGSMSEVSSGNLDVEIPSAGNDEIGDMARALGVFKDNALKVEAMAADQRREQEEKEARQRAVESMISEFEGAMSSALGEMAAASGTMRTSAESMNVTADKTAEQGQAAAAASTEAASNVQTVAAASEELSASIQEVSRQVGHSARIAEQAVGEAAESNKSVSALVQMANKVGEVVGLINDIAEQTNLLALNATIEAARAGDAGKGFAVVAHEVKSLANQTARATEEISSQIGAMQSATEEAVEGIGGVGKIIDEMSEISTSIASAMEEQDVTTQEIARNVQEAARGTQEVDANMAGVSQAAGETGAAAGEVLTAAGMVNDQSDTLRGAVEKFLVDVKAA